MFLNSRHSLFPIRYVPLSGSRIGCKSGFCSPCPDSLLFFKVDSGQLLFNFLKMVGELELQNEAALYDLLGFTLHFLSRSSGSQRTNSL